MHTCFLIFFVATSLVAAYLGYLKWFEIEPVDEIHAMPIGESWNTFMGNYKKQYESTGEEVHKRSVFAENMKKVVIHNQKYKKGEKSYWLGMNHFSDLTAKEFKALYCGCIKMSITLTDTNCSTFLPLHNVVLPDTVDWRERGYVTPVKDQSPCGSCWAFSALLTGDGKFYLGLVPGKEIACSNNRLQCDIQFGNHCYSSKTTGSLEGQYSRKTRKLRNFSVQQLVDCSKENNGCKNGYLDKAFEYIKIFGIENEQDYPYVAKVQSCKYDASKVVTKVSGYVNITSGCESALQQAVATIGPVSVHIDANRSSFKHYSGGVYNDKRCSSTHLNHAVLVVGYGTHGGQDYWLVKNSWGQSWGEKGYMKMARNKGNMCGIASLPMYPLM